MIYTGWWIHVIAPLGSGRMNRPPSGTMEFRPPMSKYPPLVRLMPGGHLVVKLRVETPDGTVTEHHGVNAIGSRGLEEISKRIANHQAGGSDDHVPWSNENVRLLINRSPAASIVMDQVGTSPELPATVTDNLPVWSFNTTLAGRG